MPTMLLRSWLVNRIEGSWRDISVLEISPKHNGLDLQPAG
jgi:hypothetical protein